MIWLILSIIADLVFIVGGSYVSYWAFLDNEIAVSIFGLFCVLIGSFLLWTNVSIIKE